MVCDHVSSCLLLGYRVSKRSRTSTQCLHVLKESRYCLIITLSVVEESALLQGCFSGESAVGSMLNRARGVSDDGL